MTNLNASRLPEFFCALGQLLGETTLPTPPNEAQEELSDFLADLRRMQKFYGIFSSVGRLTGTTPQHVRHVALGLTTSSRVMAVLEQEYRRIQQELGESEQLDQKNGNAA